MRLVESNPTFAATFLIGANHGLARELLWRGYPVDLRATFFQRFWRYVRPERRSTSTRSPAGRGADSLDENLPDGTEPMTVFVIRGDVVRRYPTAHYFLQKARLGRDLTIRPVAGQVAAAVVRGMLDRDTLFVGFEKSTDEVLGDRAGGGDPGWLLAIEEQPAAPRFGLDDPTGPGRLPRTAGHLERPELGQRGRRREGARRPDARARRRLLARGRARSTATTRWGRNAAHMARACYQAPFRIYFPADQLV